MRKSLVLLLSLCLIIIFTGCTDSREELEQMKAEYEKYVPYFDLIDAIESENFTKAFELLEGYRAGAYYEQIHSGEIEEIVIEPSNWSEYFSVEKITEWQENEFGEAEGFITHITVVLSDDVASRIVEDRTNVDFQWQATCSVKNCTVDLDNRVVHYENIFQSQSTTFGEPELLCRTASFHGNPITPEIFGERFVATEIGEIIIVGEYLLNGESKPVCFDYDEISINDAQGVLTLYKTN